MCPDHGGVSTSPEGLTPTLNPGRSGQNFIHVHVDENESARACKSGDIQKFLEGCAVPGRPDRSLSRLEGRLGARYVLCPVGVT